MQEVITLIQSTKNIIMDKDYINIHKEKGDSDYVTLVDIKVQEYISQKLETLFPDYEFMGEEGKYDGVDLNKPTWVLDPIDGTTNLMHNYEKSAVSLALWDNQRLEFGVIYNPFNEELFTAHIGQGAYLNGEQIHVSNHTSMMDSLISIGTSPYDKDDSLETFLIYHKIFLECQDIRRLGSAALDIAYIAAGRTEAYFENTLMPWDYAAAALILQEAGGKITTFQNGPISMAGRSSILATNGGIHSRMLKHLEGLCL